MRCKGANGSRCWRPDRLIWTAVLLVVIGCGSGGSGGTTRPPCLQLEPDTAVDAGSARLVDERYPSFRAASQVLEAYVAGVVLDRGQLFDWNRADDAALCAALNRLAVPLVLGVEGTGVDQRRHALDALMTTLTELLGGKGRIVSRSDRLGTLRLFLDSCSKLGAIRTLQGVAFVEVELGLGDAELLAANGAEPATDEVVPRDTGSFNPGLYDPTDDTYTCYADYLEHADPDAATRIRRQHAEAVYDELGYFGCPEIGVAVVDNGVLPEWVSYLSTGHGNYRTAGFHKPDVGEIHPRDDDFLGFARLIPGVFDHGTRQSLHVQSFAPHASRATVRASSFPMIFLPGDFAGVTSALLDLADDDDVRIVSMSMGTIFHSHEMERAIEAFHGRGKILIAAAGTTFPVLRDLVGVVFPAMLPIVVSSTGLSDTEETGGVFQLGETSHGGPENDFVIEPSRASSESVSGLAGLIATLWSIDPNQPRESILDALIRSSNFYRETGAKDPVFGWGRVDAYSAARAIQEGGCMVEPR